MTKLLFCAASWVVALALAGRAPASPIEIRFTGTVTSVEEFSILPVVPAIGERFSGSLYFDTDDVGLSDGGGNYVVSSEIPASFDLGGVAYAGGFYQFVVLDDLSTGYPQGDCLSTCDVWEMNFTSHDPNLFETFLNQIEFLDQTGTAFSGGGFFVPASAAGWSRVRLRIIHRIDFGFRPDLEASIDSWVVVPEADLAGLLVVALAVLGTARTRALW